MLVMQDNFAAMIASDVAPIFFGLVDSSPQGGRNWELAKIQGVRGEHLHSCDEAAREMMRLELLSEDRCELRQELKKTVGSYIFKRVLPPTALGTRQSGLPRKLRAVVHSLRLESTSWAMTSALSSCFLGLTSDMGTEADLNTVNDISVSD
eukprot:9366565-Pyramimonas_sp.AAC.1